jgi:hypothetical protein
MLSFKPKQQKIKIPVSLSSISTMQNFDNHKSLFYEGSFIEYPGYRNSRMLRNPNHNYVCFVHDSAYMVVKHYGSTCHILDFSGTSRDVDVLLNATKTLSYRHGCNELTVWCAKNDYHVSDMNDFFPNPTAGSSVILLATKITATDDLIFDRCHFQMYSEEIY